MSLKSRVKEKLRGLDRDEDVCLPPLRVVLAGFLFALRRADKGRFVFAGGNIYTGHDLLSPYLSSEMFDILYRRTNEHRPYTVCLEPLWAQASERVAFWFGGKNVKLRLHRLDFDQLENLYTTEELEEIVELLSAKTVAGSKAGYH